MHQRRQPLYRHALHAAVWAFFFTAVTLLMMRWWAWTTWVDVLPVLATVCVTWFVVDLVIRVQRGRSRLRDQL